MKLKSNYTNASELVKQYQLKIARMSKKYLLLVLFISFSGFAQSVNDYQYVVVPTKFVSLKDNDKYRLNTSTKLLLEKYGFKTFMSTDDIPGEIVDCKRLFADLVTNNDLMTTKVKIVLKDCRERVVFETDYGKSREKDYAIAYNQAFREAAKSFERLNYKYNGKSDVKAAAIPVKNEGIVSTENTSDTAVTANNSGIFYFAQPTANGFQVIDNEPKIIMRLFNTSQKNVFIAERGTTKGVVVTKNGQWYFEYNENSKQVSEPLNLKF